MPLGWLGSPLNSLSFESKICPLRELNYTSLTDKASMQTTAPLELLLCGCVLYLVLNKAFPFYADA